MNQLCKTTLVILGVIAISACSSDPPPAPQAQQKAQYTPMNETVTWQNPDSGNYGTVTPVREGTTASGAYCREFQQTITVGGKTEEGYGTACRQPDGSWKIAGS